MALAPKLELKHSQSLVMTQQLQQSIKLLQMNAQELRGYVESQLEENPFLKEEEQSPEQADVSLDAPEEWNEADNDMGQGGDADFMPEEWQPAETVGDTGRISIAPRSKDGDLLDFGDTRARDITLKEHLDEQLHLETGDPLMLLLGGYLIDLVDESGYIREDMNKLAEQLGTEKKHLLEALSLVQRFDPSGVGARDIKECLALQLKEKNRLDPAMDKLLGKLDMLAQGNLASLRKHCGVDEEDLRDMIAEIRELNPKPGIAFNHEIVQSVEPDITVRRDNKGSWHVELNNSALPHVLVNRRYFARISEGINGPDKKYMTERMHEANWLVKALNQRAETILKVATSIVAAQEGFFRMGIHHLRPLTLKDIAKETGYHESTISRVTTGKYMITPRGTFELKYFFTSGLSHKAGGDDVSSQTVKHLIKEMIDKEENGKILSDDELASKLKEKNINVARRTVAKYREALGIPSSTQRRRQKQLSQA